jgi:hypothetical protein
LELKNLRYVGISGTAPWEGIWEDIGRQRGQDGSEFVGGDHRSVHSGGTKDLPKKESVRALYKICKVLDQY